VNPHAFNALIALRDGTIIPESGGVVGPLGGILGWVKARKRNFLPCFRKKASVKHPPFWFMHSAKNLNPRHPELVSG
jgi:hypothetical protein